MLQHGRSTRWQLHLRLALASVLLVACTKPNPQDCSDGTSTDPDLPFCGVGGEIAHTPLTCIAVACTPNTFAACRADAELTCNAAGTDDDAVAAVIALPPSPTAHCSYRVVLPSRLTRTAS